MNHGVTSDVLVHLMLKNWNALLHAIAAADLPKSGIYFASGLLLPQF